MSTSAYTKPGGSNKRSSKKCYQHNDIRVSSTAYVFNYASLAKFNNSTRPDLDYKYLVLMSPSCLSKGRRYIDSPWLFKYSLQ